MWVLFQFLVGIAFWILLFVLAGTAVFAAGAGAEKDPAALAGMGIGVLVLFGLYGLIGLFFIIPSLAVAVRRLHDTDRSGWWLLAPLACELVMFLALGMAAAAPERAGVPATIGAIAGLATFGLGIMLLVFMFLDGTPGQNRYGPDPKGRVAANVFS